MAQWQKTNERTRYGVVIYNYKDDGPHRLKLKIGETVYIYEENDEWYRGCNTKNKQENGIFPKNYVHIKEANIISSGSLEIIQPTDPPIALEISSVLREWGSICKYYFEANSPDFETVRTMMYELIGWRSKIMYRKLTVDELKEIKQKATSKIDMGNALLDLDLVVRDEQGNILDPEKTSTVKLYRQHVIADCRIQSESSRNETENKNKCVWRHTFGLYVMLRNFVCRIGEDADLMMNLYDSKQGCFMSENYVVKWGKKGLLKDLDMLNNLRVVFTDLGSKDRARERVHLLFQILRIGVMDVKDVDNKKQTQGLRRPFGVAAMDVTGLVKGTEECNEDTQHFIPFQQCGDREFMENVIKKAIGAKDINHKGQGFWVSMKILQGDLKQVKEEYPHLVLPGTAVSRKMGFPEVIMPGDVRNDIYLTLLQGEFNKGSKTSDKNVEVSIQVCNHKGEILKEVISEGAGGDMVSEYRSCVYYHEDRPKWFETVKIAISTEEEFKGLHLKFLFKHRSSSEGKDKLEKPFAMAFIRLMNASGTTLEDTVHELLVYKIESKKMENAISYLDLPATRAEYEREHLHQQGSGRVNVQKSGLILSNKDSVQIETYVCSTKLTHNVNLLGLLKWQEILNDADALKRHLEALMKVDGEEIVKFLQDLLDSLFSILMQNNNSETYENLVFGALIHIISLISDRKYHQFRPVLDAYIATTFSFAMAYSKLIVILKDYVDNANENHSQDLLLQAMKSLEYIFKFIIRSRVLFSIINDDRGREQFEITLKQLLQAINGMMLYTTDRTLLVQGAALKYICATISDIITVFNPSELSYLVVEFISNVPKDRLTKQKMKCIDDLVHSELFKQPDCRHILLPMILHHAGTLLSKEREMEECATVLSDVMDILYDSDSSEDMTIVMQQVLRTVIQTVIGMDRNSKLVGNFLAVMIAILQQMTKHHYELYIDSFPTQIDLLDFLTEILMVFQDLVSKNVYQKDWNDMVLLQNSVILRALQFFANTIKDRFSTNFEYQLWNNFFHCAIYFLVQEPLQLEKFSSNKRAKIFARYKDMRRVTGFEIRSMWFNLGHNKSQFIPEMVGPVLEMTLIPETELRKATIPIFFDMMQCEFLQLTGTGRRPKGNFNLVENEIITKLDVLVEGGRGDEHYMELIYDILHSLFDQHRQMKEQGLIFVETIRKLLQRLLEYRIIIQHEIKEHRMSCIVNLLNFYHDIERQEMYIRYLHKLCSLHLECDNYTEAAATLMLYAKLLQWNDEPLPPVLQSEKYPEARTHSQLKEKLYNDMISYYEMGKMWEKGIELCKELAGLYESELFDYESLSALLKKQADLYDSIMKSMRPAPEYFRVGYYGKGFPSFLQNQVFVYRGKEYERLSDFNARLQTLFPNAELMKTLSIPGEDIMQSQKQFLQINAVNPIMELQDRFRNKHVSESILKYYAVNEVQKFTYSRRTDDRNSVTNMWLERTNLVTSHPLPGILRWFPVVSTHNFLVSPIETAIETLEATNKKIRTLTEQHKNDSSLRVDPLSMLLNGVVDAAVNKGIVNYKVFYSSEYLKDNSSEDDVQNVEKLKKITTNQVLLLRDALAVHKQKAHGNLMPFHAHMEQRFSELCNVIERECGIRIADKGFTSSSIKRNFSLPIVNAIRPSSASITSLDGNHMPHLTKSMAASRSQSVWVKQDKTLSSSSSITYPIKNIMNMKRVSQVSDHSSNGSSQRNSGEQIIELNEQLTPKRPLRPDNERRHSRPQSSQLRPDQGMSLLNTSASSLCSNNSNPAAETSDSETSDEPPPLPEKQAFADYSNMMAGDIPIIPQRVSKQKNIPKNKPPPPVPVEEEEDNLPPVPRKPPLHR